MKKLVIDLDGTITIDNPGPYDQKMPNQSVVQKLHEYKAKGFEICIATARNMRTYEGDVGKINVHTLPVILKWLDQHKIPYDTVQVGKPWCGFEGFYVDDKAIRPSEFTSLSQEQISDLLEAEVRCFKEED